MKKPWENLAFTWWPSWVGTDPGFPAVPAQPVEEAWRVPRAYHGCAGVGDTAEANLTQSDRRWTPLVAWSRHG